MVLLDGDEVPALCGAAGCTLGGGLFVRMAVSSSNICVCFLFVLAEGNQILSIALTNSSAAQIVQLSLESVGSEQWFGNIQ